MEIQLESRVKVYVIHFFLNDENLQVANRQIDKDTLIAVIKAKSQKFSQGFRPKGISMAS